MTKSEIFKFRSSGGDAKWKKMSPEKQKEHIDKMNTARKIKESIKKDNEESIKVEIAKNIFTT